MVPKQRAVAVGIRTKLPQKEKKMAQIQMANVAFSPNSVIYLVCFLPYLVI